MSFSRCAPLRDTSSTRSTTSTSNSTPQFESGHDPNDEGRAWYRYRVATTEEIDRALEFASAGFATWHRLSLDDRRVTLLRAAEVMAERRTRTIAVMARDGGKTVAEADPEVSEGYRLRSLLLFERGRRGNVDAARRDRGGTAVELPLRHPRGRSDGFPGGG